MTTLGLFSLSIPALAVRAGSSAPAPTPTPTPTLFAFNDNFTGDGPLRTRSGWSAWGDDWRDRNALQTLSGLATRGTSFSTAILGAVDVGRIDGQYLEVTTGSAGTAEFVFAATDEKNYCRISILATTITSRRIVNGVQSATLGIPNRTAVAGDVWRLEKSGTNLLVYLNGARYPNGSTTYDLSQLPPSSRVGFSNVSGAAADAISAGYGAVALPRVAIDPIRRIFQRGATSGTAPAIAIGGACSGVAGLEFRVENVVTGAPVSGWDWGAKALTGVSIGSTSYTANVPAGLPTGEGYRIRVRATNDNAASSSSNPFAVGDIHLFYGQSNGGGLYSGATLAAAAGTFVFSTFGGATTAYSIDERFSAGGILADTAHANICNIYTSASGVPTAILNRSISAQQMVALRPTSVINQGSSGMNAWSLLLGYLAAIGNDVASFTIVHGEGDAGSTLNATTLTFDASASAVYKSGLDEMYASLKSVTGRTAAQLPFMVTGLGRLANGDTGETKGPNWPAVRKCQFEWCRDTPGATLICSNFDAAMNTGQDPAWHYSSAAGYPEIGKRVGAGMSRVLGYAATDRRGAIPLALTVSGMFTLTMTFTANGTTGLTFAAGTTSPTNLVFGTDNTFAMPRVPTGFTIDSPTQVTFTFALPVSAGMAVRPTQAQNPDVPNFLFSTYADGSVMIFPPFGGMVAV